jgi:hypothetical protein
MESVIMGAINKVRMAKDGILLVLGPTARRGPGCLYLGVVMCYKRLETQTAQCKTKAVCRFKFWSVKIHCSISFVFGNKCPTVD